MYYKRVLLGKGMHLFAVLVISATHPLHLCSFLGFAGKRMVLGAQNALLNIPVRYIFVMRRYNF
jgi:hypothetical protein